MRSGTVVRAVVVRVCRRHPAVAVYVIVVAAHIARAVYHAGIGVVRRDVPGEVRRVHRRAETQVLRRVVHVAGTVEPYALQVQRHVYLVAGVGVVAVDPQLIVG